MVALKSTLQLDRRCFKVLPSRIDRWAMFVWFLFPAPFHLSNFCDVPTHRSHESCVSLLPVPFETNSPFPCRLHFPPDALECSKQETPPGGRVNGGRHPRRCRNTSRTLFFLTSNMRVTVGEIAETLILISVRTAISSACSTLEFRPFVASKERDKCRQGSSTTADPEGVPSPFESRQTSSAKNLY